MDRIRGSERLRRLKRAVAYRIEAKRLEAELEGLGRDPSHERDVVFDAYCAARDAYRRIVRDEWQLRSMERWAPGKSIPEYPELEMV